MEILERLEELGAIYKDRHFVYASGKHGPHYINIDPAFTDVDLMWNIALQLGEPFADEINAVVGAATGGIPLAYLTAAALNIKTASWADKKDGGFVFERPGHAESLRGKQVRIVEDLLNSGSTTKQVIALVRACGGEVVDVSVVCNRGKETAESLDVPRLIALQHVDFEAYNPDECPLCASNKPIVADSALGHGEKYELEYPDYAGGYVRLLPA